MSTTADRDRGAHIVIDFADCASRAEALARFETWLDAYLEEQVRRVAGRWSADDGERCDQQAFASELAQLRAVFRGSRAECLAAFTRALDAGLKPERREDA